MYQFSALQLDTLTKAIYGRKSLFWLNGSRGLGVHHGGKAQQQVAGMAAGAGSCLHRAERATCKLHSSFNFIGHPSDGLPSAGPHHVNLPKQCHQQPETKFKCLSLWGTILIQTQSEALKPFAFCSGILCGSLISFGFSLGVTATYLGHPGLLFVAVWY